MDVPLGAIEAAIREAIDDAVADLLYYDRKGDEHVPLGAIEAAIAADPGLEAWIVDQFKIALHRGVVEGR